MRQRVFKFRNEDRVQTIAHAYTGIVHKKHHVCPMDDDWINAQRIPVNPADMNKPWYTIHTDEGGSVVRPESDVLPE
jgi:hypothetical protein